MSGFVLEPPVGAVTGVETGDGAVRWRSL